MILEGASEARGPSCHLRESSCGLQADRLTLPPGHCGHLSYTGQMPKSKIFAPQNKEAEICDSLLLPSFYRVDKKICWLPCRIICKGNVICLCFINPIIMLAMKLPTWLLHVFFKQISQHFARSLSNTTMCYILTKWGRIVQKGDLKAPLNISGNYSALEQDLQLFAVLASLSVSFFLLHNWNCCWDLGRANPTCWAWFLNLSISSTADSHPSQGVLCKQGDYAIHKQLQGCRDMFSSINPRAKCQRYVERLASSRRWQETGTWNILRSSGSKGDGIFCLP